jgi:osmotically inducible protein OsmC
LRDERHSDKDATVGHRARVLWVNRGNGAHARLRAESQPLSSRPLSVTGKDDPRDPATSAGELLAAAHCSSYAVTLGELLAERGLYVREFTVDATCHLQHGPAGRTNGPVQLTVRGRGSRLDRGAFAAVAQDALSRCPVSNALSGASTITIDASVIADASR